MPCLRKDMLFVRKTQPFCSKVFKGLPQISDEAFSEVQTQESEPA